MVTKFVAATLFLTFLVFVNLAAAITASLNRAETSMVASIAVAFQVLVDVGAFIAVVALTIRFLMKMAEQPVRSNRQPRSRQPNYQYAVQPVEVVNQPNQWNGAAPLPFEQHPPVVYNNVPAQQVQNIPVAPPPQGVLTDNIHRMKQRGGYRMVR
jgi:hypothetical protein